MEYIAPLLPLMHLTHLRLPIFTHSLSVTQSATYPRPAASLEPEKLVVMSMLSRLSPSIKVLGFYRQFNHPHLEDFGFQILAAVDLPGWCDWIVTRDSGANEGEDDIEDEEDGFGRGQGHRRREVKEVRPVWSKVRQVPVKKTWLRMFDTSCLY